MKRHPDTIGHAWDVLYRDAPKIYDAFSASPYDPRWIEVVTTAFPLAGKIIADGGSSAGGSVRSAQMNARVVVFDCHVEEIRHVQQSGHEPHRRRDGAATFVVDEARLNEAPGAPARVQFAAAGRQHVADPLRFAPVGERDDEAARAGKTLTGVR